MYFLAAHSFWDENGDAITTLAVYAAGILGYALVVNVFYQIISRRIMFGAVRRHGEMRVKGPMGGFAYLLVFPFISFAFFLLLSLSLLFLGGENQDPAVTFTLAMAVVLAVRVAAYFSEPTSHDVAKMLPLGLLGVILVRAEFINVLDSIERMTSIVEHVGLVAVYFGVVVVVEYVLRIIWMMFHPDHRGPRRAKRYAKREAAKQG